MTKAELVSRISEVTYEDKALIAKVLDATMEEIKSSVAHGHTIYLRGFATIESKERQEKVARNIKAGKQIIIPAHRVPAFRPCREFKEMVARRGRHE